MFLIDLFFLKLLGINFISFHLFIYLFIILITNLKPMNNLSIAWRKSFMKTNFLKVFLSVFKKVFKTVDMQQKKRQK